MDQIVGERVEVVDDEDHGPSLSLASNLGHNGHMMGPFSALKLTWAIVLLFIVPIAKEATPEATINAFVEAWNVQNYAKAATYVVGGKQDNNFASLKHLLDAMKVTVTNIHVTTKGDRCKATYDLKLEMPSQPATNQRESVDLVKVDGVWLLVPAVPSGASRDVLPSLAVMTTTDLSGVFASAKKAAKKTACLSNIKQLSTAVLIYLSDYDDKFSMDPSRMKAALHPYTKNDQLWICPLTPNAGHAYSFNAKLWKKNHVELEDPVNTVMLYEGSKGQLDFKHGGFAAVAFADGHAKMINVEGAKKLRWNP